MLLRQDGCDSEFWIDDDDGCGNKSAMLAKGKWSAATRSSNCLPMTETLAAK